MLISINTRNAAFDDENKGYELARILRELADKFEEDGNYNMDVNGNIVGAVKGK